MAKILAIYGSKYGSTKEIVETLAKELENLKLITPAEFVGEDKDYECVLIASGIYAEEIHPEIINFVDKNERWLKQKKIILLGVCLAGQRGISYLDELKKKLGSCVIWVGMAKGRLILNHLGEEDFTMMKIFANKVKMPFIDRDFIDPEELLDISSQINTILKV
ncbi:flavodoxin domain-containing protein [Candidatus Lokiarchaeum ossiferum]|uniref:flavodoxin domain-containing protein n=1 Tax=Candidatus Lokiarchaeum ossiferum TaxID=2951803 RepID=UPI00352C79CC